MNDYNTFTLKYGRNQFIVSWDYTDNGNLIIMGIMMGEWPIDDLTLRDTHPGLYNLIVLKMKEQAAFEPEELSNKFKTLPDLASCLEQFWTSLKTTA